MRWTYVTLLGLLCSCPVLILAADAVTVQNLRGEVIGGQVLSAELVQECERLLATQDAGQLVSTSSSLFAQLPQDPDSRLRRKACIVALLFTQRNEPRFLIDHFEAFTSDERQLILELLSGKLKGTVGEGHLPMVARGLTQAIEDAQRVAGQEKVFYEHARIAQGWMTLGAQTRSEQFGQVLLQTVSRRVVNTELRYLLVAHGIERTAHYCKPLCIWYFQEYCSKPDQARTLVQYLRTYVDDPNQLNALLRTKQTQLEQASRVAEAVPSNPSNSRIAPAVEPHAAADSAALERIRKDLLDAAAQQELKGVLTAELAASYKALCTNLNAVDVVQTCRPLFEHPPKDRFSQLRRQGCVIALLLAEHQSPRFLCERFDSLTDVERQTILGMLLTKFRPIVGPGFSELAMKGFSAAVTDAEKASDDAMMLSRSTEVARSWLSLAAMTGDQRVGEQISQVVMGQVVNPDLRFNLLGEAVGRTPEEIGPLCTWYFRHYCQTEFQTKVLVDCLAKSVKEPTKLQAILRQRQEELKAAAKEMGGEATGRTPATPQEKR